MMGEKTSLARWARSPASAATLLLVVGSDPTSPGKPSSLTPTVATNASIPTDDLGLRLPDGCLVHMGRKDSQVKNRGYSVEVAEVEKALLDLDTVVDACVVSDESGPGDPRLAAYVVSTQNPGPTVTTWRCALSEASPDYMVPSAFVFLEAMPFTATSKLVHQELPDPGRARPQLESPAALPRTPVEEELVAIWTQVLGLDEVGIHDNFLELGGDSLLDTQIISRVGTAFQMQLSLQSFGDSPTVAHMAAIMAHSLEGNGKPKNQLVGESGKSVGGGLPSAEAGRMGTPPTAKGGE